MRNYERHHGRFKSTWVKRVRRKSKREIGAFEEEEILPPAPFQLTKAQQEEFDRTLLNFPFPTGVNRLRGVFSCNQSEITSADWISLLSPLGVLAIGSSLPLPQRQILTRLFAWVSRVVVLEFTLDELQALQTEICEILAIMEQLFPLFLFSLNFHLLVHIPSQISEVGPLPTVWMFPSERYQGQIVKALQSHRNPELSISRSIMLAQALAAAALDGEKMILNLGSRIEAMGASKNYRIPRHDLDHIQVMFWRNRAEITSIFETYLRVASNADPIPFKQWKPRIPMTPLQKSAQCGCSDEAMLFTAVRWGKLVFRGISRDKSYCSQNCVVGVMDPEDSQLKIGLVHHFLLHQPYPTCGEGEMLVAAQFFSVLGPNGDLSLPRIRIDSQQEITYRLLRLCVQRHFILVPCRDGVADFYVVEIRRL
jgi:hypothetical protein